MAFDPHIEDFQRLGLRYAATLDTTDPFGMVRTFASFRRRYAQNRDAMPQTDADRAFNLVAQATDLIDYQLPFADDEGAAAIISEARRLLNEAVDLDAECHDARRMLAAADNASFEQYYRFLADGAEDVRTSCERACAAAQGPSLPPELAAAAGELAMRPYMRWLAALASHALECGHYGTCISEGAKLLALDPADEAEVRYSMALAYAKLEDEAGLAALMERDAASPRPDNPWYSLARCALAFKARRFDAAETELSELLRTYTRAGMTLTRQDWLPDGVYSRIIVRPMSEDELILAVSEATVILQEGCDSRERGAMGSWVATRPAVMAANKRDEATLMSEPPQAAFPFGPEAGGAYGQDGAAGADGSSGGGDTGGDTPQGGKR